MKKSQIVLAASIGLLLSACAGNKAGNTTTDKVVADNEDRVCVKAARVGTHLKKKRCMSKEQAEEEREVAQELMRSGVKQGSILPNKN